MSSKIPVQHTLGNGLKVIHIPFPGIETVSMSFYGNAGAAYESMDNIGTAHALEHLLFKGTKKYPSVIELKKSVEDLGGYADGSTSLFYANYFAKTLKEDLKAGFEFLSQLIIYPLLKEEYLKRELKIIEQETLSRDYGDEIKFYKSFYKKIFPNQRLGESTIGSIENIRNISLAMVNQFYDNFYNAQNFVLSVCCDEDSNKIFHLANEYFKELKAGFSAKPVSGVRDLTFEVFSQNSENRNQAMLEINYQAPAVTSEKRFETMYLVNILGDPNSRLYEKIRYKLGLTYRISCKYYRNIAFGEFVISLKFDEKNLEQILKLIKEEILDISTFEITDQEMQKQTKSIKAREIFDNENPFNRVNFYSYVLLSNANYKTQEDYTNRLLRVTKTDILNVAKELFSKKPKIGIFSKSISSKQVQDLWV